jgi:ABC-2 type transport system permease protein
MNAFAHHFKYEFRIGIRNKQLLMMNYLFPLGFYLMMGFIMPSIFPPFREVIIPAMVVFAALASTLLGIPDPLVNARENGIFRSYKINGVPSLSILVIPALTTILHLAIVIVIITVSAPLLFDAPTPVTWADYIIILTTLAIACSGISVLIGVISPSSRMTVLWSMIIFIPSMLLGGMMMPLSLLPEIAGKFAQLLPATHAMNAFTGLVMGKEAVFSPWGSVFILLTSGILAFGLAVYLFRWDSRNTTQRRSPWLALLVLLPYFLGILLLV